MKPPKDAFIAPKKIRDYLLVLRRKKEISPDDWLPQVIIRETGGYWKEIFSNYSKPQRFSKQKGTHMGFGLKWTGKSLVPMEKRFPFDRHG